MILVFVIIKQQKIETLWSSGYDFLLVFHMTAQERLERDLAHAREESAKLSELLKVTASSF